MGWLAFNKHGDFVLCGELFPEFGTPMGPTDGIRWHVKEYAEWIQLFESDSEEKPEPFRWARGKRLHIYRRWMDTFGAAANSDTGEDYFESYRKAGRDISRGAKDTMQVNLNYEPALKGHDNLAKAYDFIARALMPQRDAAGHEAPPRFHVFENCYEAIDEFENVRFPEGTPERPVDERPVSYQKHILDTIHYQVTGRPRFVLPSRKFIPPEKIYPELGM
jgi:hypothetical protein